VVGPDIAASAHVYCLDLLLEEALAGRGR
jgi:hypothetical protein